MKLEENFFPSYVCRNRMADEDLRRFRDMQNNVRWGCTIKDTGWDAGNKWSVCTVRRAKSNKDRPKMRRMERAREYIGEGRGLQIRTYNDMVMKLSEICLREGEFSLIKQWCHVTTLKQLFMGY